MRSHGTPRTILHVDMDAFYASVEERDHPELKGRPVIVGGTGGRGVVAAANYAVRRYGVHSAMPMSRALKLCPQAVCVRPRMARYQEVSRQVFDIFHDFTPLIEGLSLDEAFLDVTASARLLGDGEAIAAAIRRRIRETTGLTASIGISPNKLLAKIASDLNKPDGVFRLDGGNLRTILDPLPIDKLYGIGRKSLPAVHAAGLLTFGDLRHADDGTLSRLFGRHGATMRARASGVDDRAVEPHRAEKSISAEETFAADVSDLGELERLVQKLADRTAARLRSHDLAAGTVVLKIRRSDFATYTRQRALSPPTFATAPVAEAARQLLHGWVDAQPGAAVRLLGVGAANLSRYRQADLFAPAPAGSHLDTAVDGIRARFGTSLLTRASLLPRRPDGGRSRHR